MQTSTKQSPKSCSCIQCMRGKHSSAGHSLMKEDERAYRHWAKIQLKHLDEDLEDYRVQTGPIGNYYD